MDGNSKKQAKVLRDKSELYAQVVQLCALSRFDAHTLYFSVYCQSIGYPLAATSVPVKVLLEAQKPAVNAFLSKMGYNCTTPRAVVFAPSDLLGIGFRTLPVSYTHLTLPTICSV